MPNRTVFFVSDGTGITAETFGNSILAQFPGNPRHIRRPFVDTVDKAWGVVKEINQAAEREGKRPIIFVTLVDEDVRDVLTSVSCKGMVLDMFRTFVEPLEEELGYKSNHRVADRRMSVPARPTRTGLMRSISLWRMMTGSRPRI